MKVDFLKHNPKTLINKYQKDFKYKSKKVIKQTFDCCLQELHATSSLQQLWQLKQKITKDNPSDKNFEDMKKIIRIFCQQFSKRSTSPKILTASLSLLCMMMHRNSTKKISMKSVFSIKFIRNFLQINLDPIINFNSSTESYICFILVRLIQNGVLEDSRARKLDYLFKQFSLQLLSKISNNPRILFNALKVVDWLQNNNILDNSDYQRYNIIKIITFRVLALEVQNIILYELSYRILIKTGNLENAYHLYKTMISKRKTKGVQSFFTALINLNISLPQITFEQILQSHIFSGNQPLSQSFMQLIRQQINTIGVVALINLLQRGLIDSLLKRWIQVTYGNYISVFVCIFRTILMKLEGTIIQSAITDYLSISVDSINQTLKKMRATQYVLN